MLDFIPYRLTQSCHQCIRSFGKNHYRWHLDSQYVAPFIHGEYADEKHGSSQVLWLTCAEVLNVLSNQLNLANINTGKCYMLCKSLMVLIPEKTAIRSGTGLNSAVSPIHKACMINGTHPRYIITSVLWRWSLPTSHAICLRFVFQRKDDT